MSMWSHDEPSAAGPPLNERGDESVGQLVREISGDMSTLFRKEIELLRAELKDEAGKAGKGAGMLGGAGFAGAMVATFASLAAVFGLARVMAGGWAALIVTGVWLVIGIVLYLTGRNRLRDVSPKPERTVETLKEDAQWARHPTR
ncbi:MAG TPA: phage holin family protein [Streptosporangiales bacterium]